MKQIFKRLRSRAGETLVESMAAILIFTMGSIIMLSMVSTAASINETAKTADQQYNDQIRVAEMTDMSHSNYVKVGNVVISINGVAGAKTEVNIFSNPDTGDTAPLYTFYKASEVIGGGSGD